MVSWDDLLAPETAEGGRDEGGVITDEQGLPWSCPEGLDVGLALFSRTGTLLHCNEPIRPAFGAGNEACRPGATLQQILLLSGILSDGQDQTATSPERLMSAHRTGGSAEWRSPDGRWWEALFIVQPDGQRLCRVLDVSHRKRLEQECRRLAEMPEREMPLAKGLAHMAHELRTPLNAIIGFSDLIRSEAIGPLGHASYAEYAQDIHDSGQLLLTAVDRISLLVKLEAGLIRPQSVEVSHRVLAALSLETVEPLAAGAGVALRDCSGEAEVSLFLDRFLASSILGYLLENAVAATQAKGAVELHCLPAADGGIALEVRDRGTGIDPAVLDTIREPFMRLDSVNPHGQAGVGMGLALADRMAGVLNCAIELESTPAHGTTARLIIPAERVVHAGPSRRRP